MTSAQILQNQAKTLTFKTPPLDNERDWIRYVYQNLDITAASRVAYIRKFQFQNTYIFAIQEYGQGMSSLSASSFSGVKPNEYRIQRADRGVVNLEQALKDVEDSSITGKAIIADVLTEGEIILQFNHERTLKASYKDFETRIGAIVKLEQISWSKAMAEELESYRNSSDRHVRNVGLNNDKIDGLQTNSSAAVSLALKTALEALSSAQTAGAKLDETNKKLGYLNEETVRQHLNSEMGIPWARAFRFDTLRDIVEWVGDRIKAGKQQKAKALRDIVRVCVGEFDRYPEPKETVDWETVFYPIVG
jgi:2-oxo-4-hydroxy-4-carboxy--5-ureidoimidazoline (OHCU) decarboxylase